MNLKTLLYTAYSFGQINGMEFAKKAQEPNVSLQSLKEGLELNAEEYAKNKKNNTLWSKFRPQEEGKFLFKGRYTGDVSIITLVKQSGLFGDEYLGVIEQRGRAITQLDGEFLNLKDIC